MTASFSSRRTVLAAGAAGAAATLTACGGGQSGGEGAEDGSGQAENGGQEKEGAQEDDGAQDGGAQDGGAQDGGEQEDGELGRTSDIPEGGGKIFKDQKVVVTQPSAGEFKAFSAVCQHKGCLVTGIADGTINCACHNSAYDLADGSVTSGPAPRGLPAADVTVEGGTIRLDG